MSKTQTRTLNVRLPLGMWEKFYRLFPEHGGRSRFIRRCIGQLILSKKTGEGLPEEIRKQIAKELP